MVKSIKKNLNINQNAGANEENNSFSLSKNNKNKLNRNFINKIKKEGNLLGIPNQNLKVPTTNKDKKIKGVMAAYKELARKYHPDIGEDKDIKKFQRIFELKKDFMKHLNPKQITGQKEANKNFRNTMILVVVLLIFFIFILPIILGYIWASSHRKKIRANWPEYRCKPVMYLFASQFGPPGTDNSKNMAYCMSTMIGNVTDKIVCPIKSSIQKIIYTLKHLSESVQNIRKVFYRLKQTIVKEFKDIQQKIYNTYRRLAYVFRVFQRLLFQVLLTFKSLFMMAKYAIFILGSLWNGPIRGIIKFFCFGGETLVKTNNGVKPIMNIKIGDIINGETKVLGTMKLRKCEEMYLYNGVYVSGSHVVFENNEWIKIKDSNLSQKVEYPFEEIYCLITENGEIKINNTIFKDFNSIEGFEEYLNFIKLIPLQNKNEINKIVKYGDNITDNLPLLSGDSKILTCNGVKHVKNIKIGDIINFQKVVGIVDYEIKGERSYTTYNDGINNLSLYGNNFIRKNSYDKWTVLSHLENDNKTVSCRGLMMENGYLDLGKIQILDFELYDTNNLGELQERLI